MWSKTAGSLSAFGLVVLLGARAHAEPRTHDGFQFRGTVGFGYLSDAEQPSGTSFSDNIHGVAGTSEVFLGGTVPPSVAIGGYLGATVAPGPSVSVNGKNYGTASSGVKLNFVTLGPYVDYYFDPHQGFHLLGTLGFALLDVSNGSASSNAATGFGVGAGVGYDFWVGSEWSLGVLGRFQYAHMTLTSGGASASEDTIAPTVAFSFTYQ